ncbi:MAG: hypothetical protein M1833_002007 [Piccolia ochrophora]|nr:MAG: hypothetical protein M1833_002007 [Piccolia ochrophora]
MSDRPRSTLIRPPPPDPSKSVFEHVLELTPLNDIGPDIFTNTRPLWVPSGARGVFGGAVIAQCLIASQRTVPAEFSIHSMHCYFVLAGNPDIPLLYHVERVREGKSFATRTVQARQRGTPIFTTTMSFVREGSGGAKCLRHQVPMVDIPGPVDDHPDMKYQQSPFESQRVAILNHSSPHPHEKRTRQWVRARGTISPSAGHEAHISALAYMSDSWFIGTVSRVHNLSTWGEGADSALDSSENDPAHGTPSAPKPEIGMIVSLDHSIYFHSPRAFRADEWLLSEMNSPWAGDGRGVVEQRLFSRDGALLATCVQEGVVRLKQDAEGVKASKL